MTDELKDKIQRRMEFSNINDFWSEAELPPPTRFGMFSIAEDSARHQHSRDLVGWQIALKAVEALEWQLQACECGTVVGHNPDKKLVYISLHDRGEQALAEISKVLGE